MENASKALLMAAGVLIALMILAALIFMFNNLQGFQNTETQGEREAQVIKFNNQYETYNRKDVRGSDLYSLLNKVIDYNRRKSTVGTGKDEGQYLAYQPMTISYKINTPKKLLYDEHEGNKIFKDGYENFTLNEETSNKLKEHFDKCLDYEKYATSSNMEKLASGIQNLYGKSDDKDILKAVDLWNRCIKRDYKVTGDNNDEKINNYSSQIDNNSSIKTAILTYYEYMQFKRAHFDCESEGVEYNSQTGRITKMTFVFNGKIN